MPWLDWTDFYSSEHALHPVAVGSCILFTVLVYLRLASNRTLGSLSIYDWVLSVTYGSTLSRIITQPDLTYLRGLLSLLIISLFEYVPSFLFARFPSMDRLLRPPPVCVVFRGEYLGDVARKNRISREDVLKALRARGLVWFEECEAVVLEGTGTFSVIARLGKDVQDAVPEAMQNVPGYVQRWHQARGAP